jgi:hypothetical protein
LGRRFRRVGPLACGRTDVNPFTMVRGFTPIRRPGGFSTQVPATQQAVQDDWYMRRYFHHCLCWWRPEAADNPESP